MKSIKLEPADFDNKEAWDDILESDKSAISVETIRKIKLFPEEWPVRAHPDTVRFLKVLFEMATTNYPAVAIYQYNTTSEQVEFIIDGVTVVEDRFMPRGILRQIQITGDKANIVDTK